MFEIPNNNNQKKRPTLEGGGRFFWEKLPLEGRKLRVGGTTTRNFLSLTTTTMASFLR